VKLPRGFESLPSRSLAKLNSFTAWSRPTTLAARSGRSMNSVTRPSRTIKASNSVASISRRVKGPAGRPAARALLLDFRAVDDATVEMMGDAAGEQVPAGMFLPR
jgi:hypothetical protein